MDMSRETLSAMGYDFDPDGQYVAIAGTLEPNGAYMTIGGTLDPSGAHVTMGADPRDAGQPKAIPYEEWAARFCPPPHGRQFGGTPASSPDRDQ